MIGADDAVGDRHVRHAGSGARHRARARRRSRRSQEKCTARERPVRLPPEGPRQLIENYYTPGAKLDGRCLYPFLHARVSFSGKVYFCPFIRVEVGDLHTQSLEEIWNGDKLRRRCGKRLVENGLFPVCRRCCKVELSPVAGRRTVRRRRHRPAAPRHSADGGAVTVHDAGPQDTAHQPAADQRRGVHPPGPLPGARRRPRHDQAAVHARAASPRCCATPACDVRLVDATAERLSIERGRSRGSTRTASSPTLILFPSTTPTLDARRRRDRRSSRRATARRCSASARTPRPCRSSSMARAPGRRRHVRRRAGGRGAAARAARTRPTAWREVRSLTWRGPGGRSRAAPRARQLQRLPDHAVPGVGPGAARRLRAAARRQALRHRRDQPRLPLLVRLLRRADPPGAQVPRAQREGAGRRDRAHLSRARRRVLLPLGRHRHAEREVVHRVLRRADRAQAADPVVRQRPRRQPDRSRVRAPAASAPAAGCWRSASRPSPKRSARTWSSGSSARRSRRRSRNMRDAGDQVVRVLHLRLSRRDARDDGPDDRVRDRAGSRLRQLLSGGAVSRAPRCTTRSCKDGLLPAGRRRTTGRRWSTRTTC